MEEAGEVEMKDIENFEKGKKGKKSETRDGRDEAATEMEVEAIE